MANTRSHPISIHDVDVLQSTLQRLRTDGSPPHCCSHAPPPSAGDGRAYGDPRPQDLSPTRSGGDPMFRTDNFMMYGFKVAMCTRQGRHPWNDCPYAHPTENARRRDPRIYSYSCVECPAYRNNGFCTRGDQCEYSHGVFEARLHPDSYRTVACKEGGRCRRKICFFYHTAEEARKPTGLQDARVQLAAEMGAAAIGVNIETVRSVANSLLASNPSLAQTMQSLGPASGPLATQCSALQSVLSNASASTPLHPSASLQADGLQSVLSGNLPGAGSGVLLAAETVAPCMKGANKNKAQVKELATEVGVHPDALMSSLRIAALQGELSPHSAAPAAPRGAVPAAVERLLMRISVLEDCPIGKLRGWLVRVPGIHLRSCAGPPARPVGGGGMLQGRDAVSTLGYGRWDAQPPAPQEGRIGAHFGGSGGPGRRGGWDAKPVTAQSNGSFFSKGPNGVSRAASAIDAAMW